MTIKTIKTVELTATETSQILCDALAVRLNTDGSLGKVTGGKAKDVEGLAAQVTLNFEAEVSL